jgi:hypothetical protein
MAIETTRRIVLVGGASTLAAAGMSSEASAFWPRWVISFSAGVAAGWLVEALKYWGLVPGSGATTVIAGAHAGKVAPLEREGYRVRPLYSGTYSGGEFELSEATQSDEFVALGTSSHRLTNGRSTCTLRFDKADAIALGLIGSGLHRKGFDASDIQACALPLHPSEGYRLANGRRFTPSYMTPSHGTIAWSTDVNSSRPNLATAIRSPVVNANLRFARMDNGKWTFDFVRA